MQTADLYFALATIAAILVGPVIAVLITRWNDHIQAQKARQWAIFRSLMQHRRTPINVEYVGALNLVEVEFANVPAVVTAWKDLLGAFAKLVTDSMTPAEKEQVTSARSGAQTRLLDAIAKHLGIKIEQLDIFSGGYSPQGWADQELEQSVIRRMFGEIAMGNRAFPIEVRSPNTSRSGQAGSE